MHTNAGHLMSEVAESGASAGALLREARLACGVHIAALAVALKVPVGKLEALEADDHSALPDTVFVRALASSVCRTLKIDAAPILLLLPRSESPKFSANSAGLNAPVKGTFGKSSVLSASSFSGPTSTSRPFVFVVLILLVGALILYFYPHHKDQGQQQVVSSDSPAPVDLASGPMDATSSVPPVVDRLASDSPAVPIAVSGAGSSVGPVSSVAVTTVIPFSPALPASSSASGPVASAGTLVLRVRSESWVQVRDGVGAVALQRNLVPGESVSIAAPAPLTVVIGRADATEVMVRGKPFDLAPVTRENVARFEVK